MNPYLRYAAMSRELPAALRAVRYTLPGMFNGAPWAGLIVSTVALAIIAAWALSP